MKKMVIAAIMVMLFCVTACAKPEETDLEKAAEPLERALVQEGFEKQRQTEVYDLVFTDKTGQQVMYYICLTTYYTAAPEDATGLDQDALYAVFSPENAVLQEELTIAGYPAAFYQETEKTYLCCTSSARVTLVLEYDPKHIPEEDMLKMMESVFWDAEQ